MPQNPLKAKLAAGQTILGLMCFEFSTSGIARLAEAAGADFVMFDMEHTGWGMDSLRQLLAATRGTGVRRSSASRPRRGSSSRPRSTWARSV